MGMHTPQALAVGGAMRHPISEHSFAESAVRAVTPVSCTERNPFVARIVGSGTRHVAIKRRVATSAVDAGAPVRGNHAQEPSWP
ncbi:MAG: hypothetical protein EOO71_40150 [Myxococcaceae bacterium]|nr:MAG: hypothetical protein EOO71_40150 [Myxococcaceae bacterium]